MNSILELVKDLVVLAFVLLIFSYLTPKESYRKYFQFFIGIIMTVIILKPVIEMFSEKDFLSETMKMETLWEQIEDISYEKKGESVFELYVSESYETYEGEE